MPKTKKQPTEQLLVFILVEARGDVDAAIKRFQGQSDDPYPMLNGSCIGADSNYGVRCLGVKKVVRLRTAMLRNDKLIHKPKRKA